MVASISARGSATAALGYYDHLRQDDYYSRGGEPPGRWAGQGAERLTLHGPVTQAEFKAALTGLDPKTGTPLTQNGRARSHCAGWDMTFSAPKSVSVLWALSSEHERPAIEQAHRTAVATACKRLEQTAAWTRRGQAGAIREPTAGLLVAQFNHHTSRELDPQLHTHCFVFNVAPRRDGTWGTIVSRDLYKAQKAAGNVYRHELANRLEQAGYRIERSKDGFRVATVPHQLERAFSKRRQAIEEAARTHGYRTAKGMELATLRTRRAKREVKLDSLFAAWQSEANALGYDLSRQSARTAATSPSRPVAPQRATAPPAARPVLRPAALGALRRTAVRAAAGLGSALQALKQPSGMPGVRLKLHTKEPDRELD